MHLYFEAGLNLRFYLCNAGEDVRGRGRERGGGFFLVLCLYSVPKFVLKFFFTPALLIFPWVFVFRQSFIWVAISSRELGGYFRWERRCSDQYFNLYFKYGAGIALIRNIGSQPFSDDGIWKGTCFFLVF